MGPVGVPTGILGLLGSETLEERGVGDFEILSSILGPLGSEKSREIGVGDFDFEVEMGSSWQLWKLEEESVLAWRGAFAAELIGLIGYSSLALQTELRSQTIWC